MPLPIIAGLGVKFAATGVGKAIGGTSGLKKIVGGIGSLFGRRKKRKQAERAANAARLQKQREILAMQARTMQPPVPLERAEVKREFAIKAESGSGTNMNTILLGVGALVAVFLFIKK